MYELLSKETIISASLYFN